MNQPQDNFQQEDPNAMFNDLNMNNQMLQKQNMDMANALSGASFQQEEEQNLIHFQLETDKILERIEHFLKGDQIKFGKDGQYYSSPTKNVLCTLKKDKDSGFIYYYSEIKEKGEDTPKEIIVKVINKDNEEVNIGLNESKLISSKLKKVQLIDMGYKYAEINDDEKKPLNEYGVAELMRIISMYVTKETFLSRYEEERINEIMGDLGDALNNFLYCNYEQLGMNNKFKESKYSLIILNILHTVESCYRRALHGAEQENIRTRSMVVQNQGMGGGFARQNMPMKRRWNPLKPSTW